NQGAVLAETGAIGSDQAAGSADQDSLISATQEGPGSSAHDLNNWTPLSVSIGAVARTIDRSAAANPGASLQVVLAGPETLTAVAPDSTSVDLAVGEDATATVDPISGDIAVDVNVNAEADSSLSSLSSDSSLAANVTAGAPDLLASPPQMAVPPPSSQAMNQAQQSLASKATTTSGLTGQTSAAAASTITAASSSMPAPAPTPAVQPPDQPIAQSPLKP
ncbi:MAG TPA: hypothetical protein VGK54_15365, partial [Chloroflexota bacterium]